MASPGDTYIYTQKQGIEVKYQSQVCPVTVCFWDGLRSDKQRALSRKAMSGSLRQNSPLSAMRTVAYIIESGQNCCERVSGDVLLTAVAMGSRLCILYHHFLLCLACSVSLLLTLRCEGGGSNHMASCRCSICIPINPGPPGDARAETQRALCLNL